MVNLIGLITDVYSGLYRMIKQGEYLPQTCLGNGGLKFSPMVRYSEGPLDQYSGVKAYKKGPVIIRFAPTIFACNCLTFSSANNVLQVNLEVARTQIIVFFLCSSAFSLRY